MGTTRTRNSYQRGRDALFKRVKRYNESHGTKFIAEFPTYIELKTAGVSEEIIEEIAQKMNEVRNDKLLEEFITGGPFSKLLHHRAGTDEGAIYAQPEKGGMYGRMGPKKYDTIYLDEGVNEYVIDSSTGQIITNEIDLYLSQLGYDVKEDSVTSRLINERGEGILDPKASDKEIKKQYKEVEEEYPNSTNESDTFDRDLYTYKMQDFAEKARDRFKDYISSIYDKDEELWNALNDLIYESYTNNTNTTDDINQWLTKLYEKFPKIKELIDNYKKGNGNKLLNEISDLIDTPVPTFREYDIDKDNSDEIRDYIEENGYDDVFYDEDDELDEYGEGNNMYPDYHDYDTDYGDTDRLPPDDYNHASNENIDTFKPKMSYDELKEALGLDDDDEDEDFDDAFRYALETKMSIEDILENYHSPNFIVTNGASHSGYYVNSDETIEKLKRILDNSFNENTNSASECYAWANYMDGNSGALQDLIEVAIDCYSDDDYQTNLLEIGTILNYSNLLDPDTSMNLGAEIDLGEDYEEGRW